MALNRAMAPVGNLFLFLPDSFIILMLNIPLYQ